jgi:aminoglycoside 6'-N-acetyltransferase I
VIIIPAQHEHLLAWAEMRAELWPGDTAEGHTNDAAALYLCGHPDRIAFVAMGDDERVAGFAEATLRRDYVEGCHTSPVVFLEGIYVVPVARKSGIARALSDAVAEWGSTRGASEYASNALLENANSHAFHAAIGFAETERVVFFKRFLTPNQHSRG